jgi:hypothetical protein
MSGDNDSTTCVEDRQDPTAVVKNVRREGGGKGRLLLTEHAVVFEARRGFFSKLRPELEIDLSAISSAVTDEESNAVVIEWLDENQEYSSTRMYLPKGKAADDLCQALDESLERIRAEDELARRRAAYVDFLWGTAYDVWCATGLLVGIIDGLTREDWQAVDGLVQDIESMALDGSIVPGVPMQALADAVPSRDGSLVLRRLLDVLRGIGSTLNNELWPAEEWGELALEDLPGLEWRDIRYIFLFEVNSRLLHPMRRLCSQEEVDNAVRRLGKICRLLGDALSEEPQDVISWHEMDTAELESEVDTVAVILEQALESNVGVA